MATAKDHITEIIKRQPDDSSYDDIVRELAFDLMVQRGLKDSDDHRTISNEEMERRIRSVFFLRARAINDLLESGMSQVELQRSSQIPAQGLYPGENY